MNHRSAIAVLTICVSIAAAEETPRTQELDVNLGWSHPFGNSVEYSVDFGGGTLLGIGGGLGMAGWSYGIQFRRCFPLSRSVVPFAGLALADVQGMDEVTFRAESGRKADTAMYRIEGGILLAPRAGIRWSIGDFRLIAGTGWGLALSGGGSEWLGGMRDNSTDRIARLFELGGPEVTISGGWLF